MDLNSSQQAEALHEEPQPPRSALEGQTGTLALSGVGGVIWTIGEHDAWRKEEEEEVKYEALAKRMRADLAEDLATSHTQEEGTGGVLQTRTWAVNPPGATGRPYLSATPTTREAEEEEEDGRRPVKIL